jgi:hypothetical protein
MAHSNTIFHQMLKLKIRPDYPFLAFTTSEHLDGPHIADLFSFYQMVRLISIFFCGIIQD